MRIYNINDLYIAALNNQEYLVGSSLDKQDSNATFFILGIYGATGSNAATLKDKDGGTVLVIESDVDFWFPIKLDGGFQASAGSSVTVVYCTIRK